MDDLLNDFLVESFENIDAIDLELVKFEKDPADKAVLENVFRMVHTIKGTCGFVGLSRLEGLTHATESILGKFRDGKLPVTPDAVSVVLASIDRVKTILRALEETGAEPDGGDTDLIARLEAVGSGAKPVASVVEAPVKAITSRGPSKDAVRHDASIRVSVDLLDELMDMAGELVLTRNQLLRMVRTSDDCEFAGPVQRLDKCTSKLQQSILKSRMQPVGGAWAKLPRLVRDLSIELGKEINLDMQGEETEIDRQLLESVRDPLTHLVRNACDHGIETPDERAAAYKPSTGTINLEARHVGGYVVITISDDGRGIDVDKLRAKAREAGIVEEAQLDRMSDDEVRRLIFHPGFSTAKKVTNLSGRGVGLDVVRNNIEHIGGTVDLSGSAGEGACFTVRIPLTLAIIKALVIEAAGETFAVPQINISELVRIGPNGDCTLEVINGAPVLRYRRGLLPVVSLDELIGPHDRPAVAEAPNDERYAVIVQAGARCFAIIVDRLLDSQEIVVKPLAPVLKDIGVYAGATILGDGQVILILDANGIADRAASFVTEAETQSPVSPDRTAEVAEQESFLVFRAGSLPLRAVRLTQVMRLETFESVYFEHADGKCGIRYHGERLPVVAVDPSIDIAKRNRQPVIIFANDAQSVGLAVDEIVDIVPDRVEIDRATAQTGTLGTARVGTRLVDVIDVSYYVGLVEGSSPETAAKGDRAPVKSQASVLLVEDSPYFQNMLRPQLKAAGYTVHCVEDADHALELRDAGEKFDLIISNLELRGMNGFEFASRIKKSGAWSDTPMVALSTLVSEADAARGRAAGFSDYVAKFDRGALLDSISTQLRRKGDAA